MNLAKNLTHDPVKTTNVAVQILYGPDYSTAISAVSKLASERKSWLQKPQNNTSENSVLSGRRIMDHNYGYHHGCRYIRPGRR